MMRRRFLRIGLLAVLLLLAGALLVGETQTHLLRHWWDAVLYDNYHHYLPCEALPTLPEVETVLLVHQAEVDAIQSIEPGSVVVMPGVLPACPGKADVVIHYPSRQVRQAIEQMLGGKTFFGLPARWINW